MDFSDSVSRPFWAEDSTCVLSELEAGHSPLALSQLEIQLWCLQDLTKETKLPTNCTVC